MCGCCSQYQTVRYTYSSSQVAQSSVVDPQLLSISHLLLASPKDVKRIRYVVKQPHKGV